MFCTLNISSPKRRGVSQKGWEGFFPYYAGFPENFARSVIESAELSSNALVFDPWNGSGTTTYAAAMMGLNARGFDINPVMVTVARARLLPQSEADSLEPLAKELTEKTQPSRLRLHNDDPLRVWFSDKTATGIRALERGVRRWLLGGMTVTPSGPNLDKMSGLAATFYVALFAVCRELASPFRSTNPTWFRYRKDHEETIDVPYRQIAARFRASLRGMAAALTGDVQPCSLQIGACEIKLANTTTACLEPECVDFVLTSPPYCTRIDYTAATRIELAVMAPLVRQSAEDLSREMIGSTRVPKEPIEVSRSWGPHCAAFLDAIRSHSSKASAGYYHKTHLDYFHKMDRSMAMLASALKRMGKAVLVVQKLLL